MRSMKYLAAVAAIALVISAAAFAKDRDTGSFQLHQAARVGSAMLQPGHYKAEWTGPNNALQVSVMQDGKTVATVKGTLKELPTKAQSDAVTLRTMSNNTDRVEEIQFHNRAEALFFPRT